MYSMIKSREGNTILQIFCTGYGWTRAFPMKNEDDAHKALSLIAHQDGVPEVRVVGGDKMQVQGEFRKKLREYGIHVNQTEPYTPKSNAEEAGAREMKCGFGGEQLRYNSPTVLWDY
jgi:uroporphyrinogen-III synthase